MNKYLFIFIFTVFSTGVSAQNISYNNSDYRDNIGSGIFKDSIEIGKRTENSSSISTFSIGLAAILYLLNPIFIFENNKIGGGFTKEISVGFGFFGEHRVAFDYSYIFRGNSNSFFRLSYKYDILLKSTIKPSNLIQGTPVLSLGGGYFTDFHGNGFFPEVSYGYSLRNHRLLIYPNIKLRYTVMTTKDKKNILDFSFGITLGIANPFVDLKIRRQY